MATARLVMHYPEKGVGKVGRVSVDSAHRGQGLGRLLMNEIEAKAQQVSLRKLVLHSQVDKTSFYGKCGYSVVDPTNVFQVENIPHVLMEKVLT